MINRNIIVDGLERGREDQWGGGRLWPQQFNLSALPMKAGKQVQQKPGPQFSPDKIIEYCRQKFINILPNTFNRQQPRPQSSSDSLAINSMYRKQEVKQLIRQLSLFLQLVIQNCVLTSDLKIRSQCLKLITSFRDYLSRDLSQFENLLCSRIKGRLPQYEVDCRQFTKRDLMLRIPPQISLYQDPLLFYIYSRAAQQELFCNHSIMMTRDERIDLLKNHIPFFNPLFIPLIDERLETKAKFSELEDRLLQIVISFSRRDISKLRPIYFPHRPEHQIKNRIKNLCGNPKELHNPIKDMKASQYLPLKPEELELLQLAFSRFGPRWPVISRYYQIRTAQFLQSQYGECDKLAKKRAKENILLAYGSLKQVLEGSRKGRGEVMQIEEGSQQQQGSKSESMQEEDGEPAFIIINNITFLTEQI